MNCPRCSCVGVQQDAPETGKYGTLRRRYECVHGHRFATVETYHPSRPTERHLLHNALRAICERFQLTQPRT
jgi:transcriptional regulator NrdR family protein